MPSSQSSKLHPLLDIKHILVKVLACLNVEELKVANLVCSTWSTEAEKLIVKNGIVRLNRSNLQTFLDSTESESQDFSSSFKSRILKNPISLNLHISHSPELLQSKNAGALYYDRGILTWDEVTDLFKHFTKNNATIARLEMQFCTRDIERAWRLIHSSSGNLFHLNILASCRICTSNSKMDTATADTANAFNFQLPAGENFSKLKILEGKYNRFSSHVKILKLYRSLIINSPILETLHCEVASSRHEVFEILKDHPNAFRNLKSLRSLTLNIEEMQVLSRNKFALNNLSFSLYGGFRASAEMDEFLSGLGNSLESLEIDFETLPRVPEEFACGIDLINLKHLSMTKFYGSVHFVEYMTKLESLILEDVNLSVALQDEGSKHEYKSGLQSLKIFGGRGSSGRFLFPAVYKDICKFFPMLKILRMEYFTDSTLKIIVKGLPHLEEVNLPNGIYTDVILTGGRQKGQDTDSANVEESLADLKKLRIITLQSPKITDVGVKYGLMYCREMRKLSINSPLISDASLHLLSENSDLLHLECINCYQLTTLAIDNTRRRWGSGKNFVTRYV